MNKLLIVAAIVMVLAVVCVVLAVTPSYHERWDFRKAGEYYSGHHGYDFRIPAPGVNQKVWAYWQKTGFSVFTKGMEDFFEAEIPQLDCAEPLSGAVFKFLQEEMRTLAQKIRDENLSNLNLLRAYSSNSLAHDSTILNTFHIGLCTPEVVSLKEYWCYFPTGASKETVGVGGRNFVLNGSAMQEIGLQDLFDDSAGRDWFAVLAKEVEADLRRQGYSEFDGYLPFEQFDQFLIIEEGLKIIFHNYAFFSGFNGFPVAYVSWDLLAPFLKPDTPVTRWVEKELQKQR